MSMVAMLLVIGSYLVLNGGMWSCLFIEIDGFLYETEPFVWQGTLEVCMHNVFCIDCRPLEKISISLVLRCLLASPKLEKTSRIGLFGYEQYSIGSSGKDYKCTAYSTDQRDELLDGPFKAARAFAVIANVLIGAGMVGLLVLSCAYVEIFIVKTFGWLLIAGSICETMTFLVVASDIADSPFNASIWWGAVLTVFSSLAALLAGVVTLTLPRSDEQPREDDMPATKVCPPSGQKERKMPPGTEITKSEILPDGRTKYITTKWNKNGSTTVQEMIE